MKQNKQVRIDGLGTQATASANRSFDSAGTISTLNKLVLLVVRQFVKDKRPGIKKALDAAKEAAAEQKMAGQATRRDKALRLKQAKFARQLIEWAVEVDTLEDYDACMADTTRGCKGRQEECMKQNYYAITSGWSYEDGITVANSTAGVTCGMCSGCACVGGWKKGSHMDVRTIQTYAYCYCRYYCYCYYYTF